MDAGRRFTIRLPSLIARQAPEIWMDMSANHGDLWIFGYGSLMWRPGFAFLTQELAVVRGYHRSLCIYSHIHRGSPDRPGLVLGLDRGGSCRGVAFQVAAADRQATIAYLREREQVTLVYREAPLIAQLADGRRVTALAYVVDRRHRQYAGRLAVPELVRLVRQGVGVSGANLDYVRNTYEHLTALAIFDRTLAAVVHELDRAQGETPALHVAGESEGCSA